MEMVGCGTIVALIWAALVFRAGGALAVDMKGYYPLNVGDVRLYLEEEITEGETEQDVCKEVVYRTEQTGEHTVFVEGGLDMDTWQVEGDFEAWTEEGLALFRSQQSEGKAMEIVNFDTPVVWIPNQMDEGQSWQFSSAQLNGSIRLEAVGETVVVKAGTFTNCVKLSLHYGGSLYEGDSTLWLAQGVGRIKEVFVSEDGTETSELMAAVVDGKLIGSPLEEGEPFSLLRLARYVGSKCGLVINNIVASVDGVPQLFHATYKFDLETARWNFVGFEPGTGQPPACECSTEALDFGNATIDGIINNRSGLPEMIMSLRIGNAVYGVGFMLSPETLNWDLFFVE